MLLNQIIIILHKYQLFIIIHNNYNLSMRFCFSYYPSWNVCPIYNIIYHPKMLTKFTQFPLCFQVLCNQSQMFSISMFVMLSFLASITLQQSTYQLVISTTISMASTRSNYTFQILQEDDYNLTSITGMQIVFPTDYQGVLTNGNYDCYVASWIDSIAIPSITCSLSGLTMSISGGFVDLAGTVLVPAYTFYAIVINQLTNPMYAVTTGAFTGLFQNTNTNSVIFNFQTNFGLAGISISEGLLTCSLTASPTTTTTSSSMILTIAAPLMIPYNTSLTISLPVYWSTNAINIATIISSASCQAIENVSSSIQCTMVTKPTAIQINVINLVSADTSSGIKFSVSSISNPPTTEPQGSINIVAKKDGTKSMARCSGAKMTGITPINFYSASFIVNNYSVNAITSGFLVFKVNSLVVVTDTIQIQFPPTLLALNVLSYISIPNGNSVDYSPTVTYNASTQVTKVITKGASAVAGATIEVQFYNVKNPPSQTTTSSMTLTLKRNGYAMEQLNTLSNPLAFKARRGAITGSVSSTTTEVGAIADYTFLIQLSNDISSSSNSLIVIYLPTLFSGAITNTSSCVPSCMSLTSTTATFLASSISSLSSTSLSCTLKLTGLLNPVQIGLTTSFKIISQLYQSISQSIVDQISSDLSMNLASRQITTIGISSDSTVVYHYPTTLTINAMNNNPIPAYSSLLIIVPSSITIQQASISCLLGTRSVPCTYNSSNNSISVTSISATSIQSGQLPTLSISNLFNPASTVPTSSFKFYIVNQFSQTIQHKQSGLTFQATLPTKFTSISISPSSTTNSDTSTSIYIGFSLPMQAGYLNSSVLAITFPALMNNIASTTCVSSTSNLISVSCTKSGNQVQATLTYSSTITPGSEAGFRVQYYQNYPSIETYNIQLTLYTSVLQQFLIAQDTVTKVNTILSTILVNSFAFSNGILTESTALTLSITPTYSGSELNQIFITFPNEFTISGGTCSSLPSGLTCGASGNIFTISRSSVSYTWIMPLQLSLSGITAPSFTPSTSLIIQTISTSGYLISRDMSIKFTTACTLPCRTCPNGNTAFCQSCYSNPALVSSKTMLDLSTSQCLAACANKYYFSNSTNQCEACSSNCELCVSFSYCTSCPSTLLLYRINNTCVSSCPFGYYGSSFFTCQQCSVTLHCGSCSNEFQCLTCSSGYYFYQNLCLQNCPSPISFTNTILNTCDSCPTNCTKCTGSLTVSNSTVACTQCQPSYLLDTSTQRCYQQCLIPGTVPNGNQCVSCQAPCLTCAVSPSNCTTCDTSSVNKYLHNNRCLSICPSLYYASDSNFTCVLCTSPCQTCTSGSISSCLTCISSYYLYNNTCTQTCPNLYYPNAYQCTGCVNPCMNCVSQLQCTSCISGKYLYGTSCVSTCDPGMTVINGNECLVCASSCKTCSSSNYCTSCYPTNYLFNGTCSILCPNGTYRDSASQTCLACNNPCSQCSSTSYCITCIDPLLYTQNGNCVSLCSGNLIPINSVCTACLVNCLTCASTINNCIRCANGYYYIYGTTLPNCVSNCSNGYIFNNVTNTGNNQCLSSCPFSYYATALGTNCLPCLTGCTTCTNSQSNCSFCAFSYYLYSSNTTCLLSCPTDAPYSTLSANSNISNTCSICNMSVCLACDILDSCRACSPSNILVYEGVYSISSYKTCIGSCPSNSSYNATQMLCIAINNNATNNSNSTQNSTVSTSSNTWKYKLIPNYLFAFILLGILPILGISKYQIATTNFKVSFYVICALLCAGVTAHVLYFEASQILGITKLSASSTAITLSSFSVSVQNPTTIIALLILGTHVIGTLILLLGLVIIRDYSLIPVISQHPIISFFLLLLFIVEYKTIWILHCGIFGIQIFMVKYCKQAMVRLLKVITLLGLIQFIMDIIYAIFVIIYTTQNISGARLLLSSISIPNQIGYLHPYIQLTVMSAQCLFTSIVLLLTKRQQYFIEEVPELDNGLLNQNQKTKISKLSDVNQSMNELLSEKDAAQRRFSNSDMYKEIDDPNHILSEEDNLYDFGLKTKYKSSEVDKERLSKVPSRISKISQKTSLSKLSKLSSFNQKLEKKEVAEVNIQVNMDQLLLPRIQEEQVLSNKNNVQKEKQKQKANKHVGQNLLATKTQQKKQIISSGQQQHFGSKERKQIVEDNAKQQNIIKQQKQQQAKSQPSWSSFKLGNKYKQEIEQQQEHIGFDKESMRSQTNSKSSVKMMRKDEGMKVYMFDQQQQSIEQVSDWQQKESKIEEQSSYQQSMHNYKDNKINSNRGNLDDRLVIKKNQQQLSVQNRNTQQQYQQQIQLTKNMPNLYHQSEQPSQQHEDSIQKHQQSQLQSQQSQYQLQKQQYENKQEDNQHEQQDQHQQLLEQDIISQRSSNINSNIFYCEQPNNQQLLSENIPEEYRARPVTQQSAAFVPFHDQDSCLIEDSLQEQDINVYLNIDMNSNEQNLSSEKEQNQQIQQNEQKEQNGKNGQHLPEQKIEQSKLQSHRQQLDNNDEKKEQIVHENEQQKQEEVQQKEKHAIQQQEIIKQEQIPVIKQKSIRQSQKKDQEIKKQFNIEQEANQQLIGADKQMRQNKQVQIQQIKNELIQSNQQKQKQKQLIQSHKQIKYSKHTQLQQNEAEDIQYNQQKQIRQKQISQSHQHIQQKQQMMKKNKNPQSLLARLKAKRTIRNPIQIASNEKNDTLKQSIDDKPINTDINKSGNKSMNENKNNHMKVRDQAQNLQDQQYKKSNKQESIKNSLYKPISVSQSQQSKYRNSERYKINEPPQRDINKSLINNSHINSKDQAELMREKEQKEVVVQQEKQRIKKSIQNKSIQKSEQKQKYEEIQKSVKKDQEEYAPLKNSIKVQKQSQENEKQVQKQQLEQQQYIQQQQQDNKQKQQHVFREKQLNQSKSLPNDLQKDYKQKQKQKLENQQNKSKVQQRESENKSLHQEQRYGQEYGQAQEQTQQKIIYVEQEQIKQDHDQKMEQKQKISIKIEESEKQYQQFKQTVRQLDEKKIIKQIQNNGIYNDGNKKDQHSIKQSQKSKNKQLSNNKDYIELELDHANNQQSDLIHTKERIGQDKNLISDRINKIKHRQQRSQILIPLKNQVKEDDKKIQQSIKKPKYHIQPQKQDNVTEIVTLNNKIKEKKKIQIEYDDAEHYQIKNNDNSNKQVDFIYRAPSEMGASLIYVPDDEHGEDKIEVMQGEDKGQQESKEEKVQFINEKQVSSNEQLVQKKQQQKPKQKGITFIQDLQQLDEMVKTPIRTIGRTRKNTSSMMNKQIIEQSDIKPSEIINNKIRKSIRREDQLMDANSNSHRQYYNNSESTNRNIFTNRELYNQTQQKQSKNRIKKQSRGQQDGQVNKMPIGIIYEQQDAQYADNYQVNKNKNKSRDKTTSMNHNRLYQYQSLNYDNNDKLSKSSNKNNRYIDVEKADQKPSLMLRGSFKKIGEHLLKGDHQN